jgi:DNA-binding beta-propeller fold protein YncE
VAPPFRLWHLSFVCAAAAALAGCGGNVAQSALEPAALRQNAGMKAFTGMGASPTVRRPDRTPSQMTPNARNNDLLYVSDAESNDVTVYAYPKGTLMGTLRGFAEPQGECSDKHGNVWIVNTGTGNLIEYAHGGTTPIAIVSDPGYYPAGCAIDPTTGNLAVANIASATPGNEGNVAIFAGGQGSPIYYTPANVMRDYFCAYDADGNLYVDGQSGPSSGFGFAELRHGSAAFTSVTLDRNVSFPGAVQWDGRHVAIGDQRTNVIYRVKVSGSKGTVAGTTTLSGASDVIQFWKLGSKVVGADSEFAFVGFWKYPAGGSPTKKITDEVFKPVGATVSLDH